MPAPQKPEWLIYAAEARVSLSGKLKKQVNTKYLYAFEQTYLKAKEKGYTGTPADWKYLLEHLETPGSK